MALIIEDGSGVANANSYVARADFIAYAATIGTTIADTSATDALLVQAAEFIASHEPNLKGWKVDRDQAMAWPRHDVFIEDYWWQSTEIPRQLILCQQALALDLNAGVDLYNPQPEKVTKREKIDGAVEVEYFGNDSAVKLSRSSRATALLNLLLKPSGFLNLVAVRA